MLALSVHLENHLRDRPFADRWQAVKDLGYRACEFVWRGKDPTLVQQLIQQTGLEVSCLGGTTAGRSGGERPALTDPEDREHLLRDVRAAIATAGSFGCRRLIMVPGDWVAGWSLQQHHRAVVDSLRAVAPLLEQHGVTVLLEPLNSRVDHKECWCDTSDKAFAVVDAVGSPAVRVLYDLYHMAVMGEDLAATIRAHHDAIGYYHIAGVPGRHEPLGGEVDFHPALEAITETGYSGYIGLEYGPALDPVASLQAVRQAYPDRL